MSGLVTDLWWFDSVGYRNVFVIQLVTKVLLFAVGFVPHRARGLVEHLPGHRLRPFVVPTTVAQRTWSSIGEPSRPCAGSARSSSRHSRGVGRRSAPGAWPTYLLWRNGSDFGVKEPHFGIDVGCFVFDLPWWRFVVSFLTVVLMLALVAALLTHYVYGGLQLPGRGPSTALRWSTSAPPGPSWRSRGRRPTGWTVTPLTTEDSRPHHGPDLHP